MRTLVDLQTSWHRLWLQVGDPAFIMDPLLMRRELAQIWAQMDAVARLGKGVDAVARMQTLRLCALAVRSLADPATFDGGYWQAASARTRVVVGAPVPAVDIPHLLPVVSTPQDLLAEILARVSPRRPGLIEPVLGPNLKVERSRPGWLLTGLSDLAVPRHGATHLGVFAIDEGDNEVLAIVPVGRARPAVDLTEDDVITGLHERARLEDRLTVAALVGVLSSHEPSPDDVGRLELAMAHSSLRSAMLSLDQHALIVRSQAVSSAVACVGAALGGIDHGIDSTWHLTRLASLL